jgi:hypothetical protein
MTEQIGMELTCMACRPESLSIAFHLTGSSQTELSVLATVMSLFLYLNKYHWRHIVAHNDKIIENSSFQIMLRWNPSVPRAGPRCSPPEINNSIRLQITKKNTPQKFSMPFILKLLLLFLFLFAWVLLHLIMIGS